ncbi:MAG TPA: histone deacetylase [Desulfomicrobiaceae bacterium]|nr:histone deacetylase [Desulfomicrobiaceae bacterium]
MLRAENSLGVVFFPAFDWAISPTHPEREERLLYTLDQFLEEGVFDIPGITEYKPEVAGYDDIERVHFCFPGADRVCTESHLISAGGAIRIARLVMEGREQRGFALVRPPGHHAMKCVHGTRGFCTVNIEAVMVEWIREHYGPKRVAVVDTDCHHGDGSQDVFWHDPDTLYISLHQDGRTLYPGTGFPREAGGPRARGRNLNIPLPPNTSDEGMLMVMERVVMPILRDFKPDLIVNSAGQDNHYSDPITNMNFSASGYARLNEMLKPDIAVLEGGYAIQGALPYVNLGITLAMAGMDYSRVREPDFDPDRFRQSAKTSKYIAGLCDVLPGIYFEPEQNGEEIRENGFFARERDIFYDTDSISEHQVEKLRDCPNCRGYLWVQSGSSRNSLSLGVEIPVGACPSCVREARDRAEEAKHKGTFQSIRMIDRVNGEYGEFCP